MGVPHAVDIAVNGDLLVVDPGTRRIIRIDPETGNQVLVSSGGFVTPAGLTVVRTESVAE